MGRAGLSAQGSRGLGREAPRAPGWRQLPVRQAALRVLCRTLDGRGNSSLLLEGVRLQEERDRGLVTELVLGTLRRVAALDAELAAFSARPLGSLDPVVRNALRLGAYQLRYLERVPGYAAVGETVEAAKREAGRASAGFVNGVLRALARGPARVRLPGPEEVRDHLCTTLSLPPFLADRWLSRFGPEATLRLAAAAQRPPPLALRVLGRRISRDQAREALGAEGVVARPGRYAPHSLVVEEAAGAALATRLFASGALLVQDQAAQLVGDLVAAEAPGGPILDACAAPGGKALAIADALGGGGCVVAAERRPARLRRLVENQRRGGLEGVVPVAADATLPPFRPAFARILVDAPCTGTGTLRRNPELRYRVDGEHLERSAGRARAILGGVAPLLVPGGRLVYATCSLEPEENEDVVAWLRSRMPDLVPRDPRPFLVEAARALVGEDLVLRTQPGEPDLDGFTVFVLERRRC